MKKLGIAAQLAKRREPTPAPSAEEEEAPAVVAPAPRAAETNAPPPLPQLTDAPAPWTGSANIREAWEATTPGAVRKKPGPQRRPGIFLKRIFTLDRDTSDYVNQAWRAYRTRDGNLVDSMSEFVTAVLAEHRERNSK